MVATDYDQLVSQLLTVFDRLQGNEKHWIGLAGAPGSGKSTITEALRRRMPGKITVISMDGYHHYREQLDAIDDPREACARRGAPFTFDAERFISELRDARQRGPGSFPSFDHTVGDPVENDIELRPGKQIVIVGGLYLLLDDPPCASLKHDVFDVTWFLEVSLNECRRRVEDRHVSTGLTREEAQHRVSSNDGPSAELVRETSARNAGQIVSIEAPINEA